jgi:uncharacterized membrane protein (UPF0127 family)
MLYPAPKERALSWLGLSAGFSVITNSEDFTGLPIARSGQGNDLERRTYCVYNQTRECFLGLRVSPADTIFARLKGLIGRVRLSFDEGLWVVPSRGVHTVGVLFPVDLIYLDGGHRVIHVVEHFPTFRIAPLKTQAASVLELPPHTIYSSQTQLGDQLQICVAEEMEDRLRGDSAACATG